MKDVLRQLFGFLQCILPTFYAESSGEKKTNCKEESSNSKGKGQSFSAGLLSLFSPLKNVFIQSAKSESLPKIICKSVSKVA